MSLIIKNGDRRQYTPILDPSCRTKWGIRGKGFIPKQIWDNTTQAEITISEDPCRYTVSSELPGVILRNLWVTIEGRVLSIYARVTGEKQENGEYHYVEKPFCEFRGEILLPEQEHRRIERAEFENGVLHLAFPKKAEGVPELVAIVQE